MKSQKTTKQQTIKMVAYNPISHQWHEVFPEDEVAIEKMVPMFWTGVLDQFVTCPDSSAADVLNEWLAQAR